MPKVKIRELHASEKYRKEKLRAWSYLIKKQPLKYKAKFTKEALSSYLTSTTFHKFILLSGGEEIDYINIFDDFKPLFIWEK